MRQYQSRNGIATAGFELLSAPSLEVKVDRRAAESS